MSSLSLHFNEISRQQDKGISKQREVYNGLMWHGVKMTQVTPKRPGEPKTSQRNECMKYARYHAIRLIVTELSMIRIIGIAVRWKHAFKQIGNFSAAEGPEALSSPQLYVSLENTRGSNEFEIQLFGYVEIGSNWVVGIIWTDLSWPFPFSFWDMW